MKGLAIGQKAAASRIFTAEDVAAYRALTGDVGLMFGEMGSKVTVPGPLLAGIFSDLLGTRLPGRGTNWLKQQLQFPAVAKVGEEITAVVSITRLRPEKQLVNLQTICTNAADAVFCTGEALVLVSDLETNE
ncbi:MAG: phosphate acetyltransferase [Chloroflexi bacterium]|nr:phosphate acetyltransferase [Chloroflexota bacterium]